MKEMVDLPEGVVLYAGAGRYVGKAPKALYEQHLAVQAKAKAAKAPVAKEVKAKAAKE